MLKAVFSLQLWVQTCGTKVIETAVRGEETGYGMVCAYVDVCII
jgi:hypothetical protein